MLCRLRSLHNTCDVVVVIVAMLCFVRDSTIHQPMGLVLEEDERGNVYIVEIVPGGNASRKKMINVSRAVLSGQTGGVPPRLVLTRSPGDNKWEFSWVDHCLSGKCRIQFTQQ